MTPQQRETADRRQRHDRRAAEIRCSCGMAEAAAIDGANSTTGTSTSSVPTGAPTSAANR
ncbi:hypothetical protein ACR6C2_01035 [Streptomyces sp. INA 01156]